MAKYYKESRRLTRQQMVSALPSCLPLGIVVQGIKTIKGSLEFDEIRAIREEYIKFCQKHGYGKGDAG